MQLVGLKPNSFVVMNGSLRWMKMSYEDKESFTLLFWTQQPNYLLTFLSAYSIWDKSREGSKATMEITLTREEAIAVLAVLKHNWIPLELQKAIFELVEKLERELQES